MESMIPGALGESLLSTSTPSAYINVSHFSEVPFDALRFLKMASQCQLIAFIHDVIPVSHPGFSSQPAKAEANLNEISSLADVLIFNSKYSEDAYFALYPNQRDLRRITEHLDPWMAGLAPKLPTRNTRREDRFVVVGTIEPRKRIDLILEVWDRIIETHGDSAPQLMLVGKEGWKVQETMRRLRELQKSTRVRHLQGIGDKRLVRLIRSSNAVLFPSAVEGFGLPLVEARSLGVPVVCSDIPVFREISGEDSGVIRVQSSSVESWVEIIERLWRLPLKNSYPDLNSPLIRSDASTHVDRVLHRLGPLLLSEPPKLSRRSDLIAASLAGLRAVITSESLPPNGVRRFANRVRVQLRSQPSFGRHSLLKIGRHIYRSPLGQSLIRNFDAR